MKPILFNTEMVRAILEDRKLVTQLVVKPQPPATAHMLQDGKRFWWNFWEDGPFDHALQPPYRPGGILYVRETWRIWKAHRYDADAYIEFKAGGEGIVLRFPYSCTDSANQDDYDSFIGKWGVCGGWHPSIHMPREAARIFLRVTDVRVQQLKDVTEEDARAEGFGSRAEFMAAILKMYPDCTEESWMWVIEFERISREEAESCR